MGRKRQSDADALAAREAKLARDRQRYREGRERADRPTRRRGRPTDLKAHACALLLGSCQAAGLNVSEWARGRHVPPNTVHQAIRRAKSRRPGRET